MRNYFKIIKYILPYKFLLISAGILSLLFSLSNSLTIYSVVPIFDTLTAGDKSFSLPVPEGKQKFLTYENLNLFDRIKAAIISVKQKINAYISEKPKKELLLIISLAIIPLVLIRGLFDFLARIIFSYIGNKAIYNIRNDIFAHLIRLPFNYFHKSRSGELMSRITTDVIPLTSALSTDIYNLFSGIILLITNIVILSLISWKMVIIIILTIPLISFPISLFGNLVKRYTKKIQESFADLSSHMQETFSGIKVIKSFSMEEHENSRFVIINNIVFIKELKKRIYQNLNPAVVELLASVAATALFIYGGYQIINGIITSGEFIFFILIVLNLFEPIKNISDAVNGAKAGEAASSRIFKILDYPKEIFETGKSCSIKKSIRFKDVSFKYLKDNVLNNINIKIPKGKKIGIAGVSGSGKTTILNLIASLYQPSTGTITFDEKNAAQFSLASIRKKISLVTQDVFLFHGSVLENLTCGQNIGMNRVIQAARTANAHDFITKLPQGYNTIVGERGALLSGGERQRISIARALLAGADVILFDEATSALDSESEALIQAALDYLFRDRTSVIVSHRLSTIRHADLIYLIEKGVIKDSGSHPELMKRSRSYRKLFSC
ncbi:MAG: ABC transporter ATP-binding protein [Spirochaetes bacterium]|nr:ABC transporter ATP-binding protein [Spirochaetota bacterium]